MTFEIDPVPPWSELRQLLADAEPSVQAVVWLTALAALVLPVLLLYVPARRDRLRLAVAGGVALLLQLFWIMRSGSPSTPTGPGERLYNASLTLLLIVPCALVGLTVRTYLQTPGLTRRRLAAVLALRLAAFLLATLAVLRPYLAFPDRSRTSGVVMVLVDYSESMTIQDESGQARWAYLQRLLKDCEPLVKRLREEQQIEVEFFRFAREASRAKMDDLGKPDGKRTDIGAALRWLYDNRGTRPLKGVLVLSDGRNNGPPQLSPIAEVRRWRNCLPQNVRCPVHTVLFGNPNTPNGQRDVAVVRLTPAAGLVQVKSEMTATARIDAPGFEGFKVRVRVLLDGQEVPAVVETLTRKADEMVYEKTEDNLITLRESRGNEIRVRISAPDKPGEVKLTVRVEDPRREGQPLPEELNAGNNQMSTLLSVIKGGISVLVVDRPRAFEPKLIYRALEGDPRIRPRLVWLGDAGPVGGDVADLFQFAKLKYDVVIIGDVTAAQIQAVNPRALDEIAGLVEKGAGLLMTGGYHTFGNGDWKGTALEKLLPVDLGVTGQEERPIQMTPTEAGLRLYRYVLGMADGNAENEKAAWGQLAPLDGMAKIKVKEGILENVLAESKSGDPILVTRNYGGGRVLAFAGDTTHRWIRSPETQKRHGRFWRQMVVWLAHQELAEGNVWVRPDVRDVPVGTELKFSVGVRSKGGIDLPEGVYQVEVQSPGKKAYKATTARQGGEDRGVFKPDEAGEYLIKVKGTARDTDGHEVTGTAEARFLVHEEDVEMNEWAADKALMDKLADEGRGRALTGAQLSEYLKGLLAPAEKAGRGRVIPWPSWRTHNYSNFLVFFFLAFVAVLAAEWVLRRRWGLV